MKYFFYRYIIQKWYMFLITSALSLLTFFSFGIMYGEAGEISLDMFVIYRGFDYNFDIRESNLPINYICFIIQQIVLLGMSGITNTRTADELLLRFGIKKYCIKKTITICLLVLFWTFINILSLSIISHLCFHVESVHMYWRYVLSIVLKISPVVMIVMLISDIIDLFVKNVYSILSIFILLLLFVTCKKHVFLFDNMLLDRKGMILGSEDLICQLIVYVVCLSILTLIECLLYKKKDIC